MWKFHVSIFVICITFHQNVSDTNVPCFHQDKCNCHQISGPWQKWGTKGLCCQHGTCNSFLISTQIIFSSFSRSFWPCVTNKNLEKKKLYLQLMKILWQTFEFSSQMIRWSKIYWGTVASSSLATQESPCSSMVSYPSYSINPCLESILSQFVHEENSNRTYSNDLKHRLIWSQINSGHSMGGMLAVSLVIRNPAFFKGMVLEVIYMILHFQGYYIYFVRETM